MAGERIKADETRAENRRRKRSLESRANEKDESEEEIERDTTCADMFEE